jgi:hypothetical protein
VETMDTSFKDAESRYDIHRVACGDCHPKGVPKVQRSGRIENLLRPAIR